MNIELQQKMLEVKFPERIFQKYYFKGHDLNHESIFKHLDIYLKAIDEYLNNLVTELGGLSPTEMKDNAQKLQFITSLSCDVEIALKEDMERRKDFYIVDSAGTKTLVKYTQSWEYLGLGDLPGSRFRDALLTNFPRTYVKYTQYQARNQMKKIMRSKKYKQYSLETNIKDKNILAYQLLNDMQKVWADRKHVKAIAKQIDVQIVRASDLDTPFFKGELS